MTGIIPLGYRGFKAKTQNVIKDKFINVNQMREQEKINMCNTFLIIGRVTRIFFCKFQLSFSYCVHSEMASSQDVIQIVQLHTINAEQFYHSPSPQQPFFSFFV